MHALASSAAALVDVPRDCELFADQEPHVVFVGLLQL